MNDLCPAHLEVDPDLHAAGVAAMPPGGWLDIHLDATAHPTTGALRAVNLICYLDSWEPAWGGALELWDKGATRCEVSILPAAGRAIAFDCRDTVHGIPQPISPFAGTWRRSLAVFWYDARPERTRAKFLSRAGEQPDDVKDAWRNERCH